MSAPNQWPARKKGPTHATPTNRVPVLIGLLIFALVLAITAGIQARSMAGEAERTVRPQMEDVLR